MVAAVDEIITVCDGVARRDLVQFYRRVKNGVKVGVKMGVKGVSKWC